MALITYDDLTATIAAYLNRTDLTAVIPDFIRLSEGRIQRTVRAFSTRAASINLPLSSTTGATGLYPSLAGVTNVEFVGLVVVDNNLVFNPLTPLQQVSEADLWAMHTTVPLTGEPTHFAITGQSLTVYPFPNVPKDSLGVDSSYMLTISISGPTALVAVPISASNYASNPLWTEHPDLYLYGALCEASAYLQEDERIAVWESRFAQIVKDIAIQMDRLAFPPGAHAQPELPVVF